MAEKPEFEGGALIGVILGFSVTFIFMLYGAIRIIMDECHRHAEYKEQLVKDVAKLESMGCDAGMIRDIDVAFTASENLVAKT